MSMLEVKDILHERGEDGELLPIEVELEVLREYETVEKDGKKIQAVKTPGPTVKITPMPRGEIKEMSAGLVKSKKEGKDIIETSKDQDDELIRKHLIEPKVKDEEIKYMKPQFAGAIATAILAVSLSADQDIMHEAGKAAIQKYAEKLDEDLSKK